MRKSNAAIDKFADTRPQIRFIMAAQAECFLEGRGTFHSLRQIPMFFYRAVLRAVVSVFSSSMLFRVWYIRPETFRVFLICFVARHHFSMRTC